VVESCRAVRKHRPLTVVDAPAPDLTDEEAGVFRYRYQQARQAGLIPEDALVFAESHADIGELRRLVAAGCPAERILAIVL